MSEMNRTPLFFNGSIKRLREALCVAQMEINQWAHPKEYSDDISQLIREIDRHRPIGPDGVHGNRHTQFCGCEDKPGWDKDLGDMSRFYFDIPLKSNEDGPVRVLTDAGRSMYVSLSRSLTAFQDKRNELLLAMDENVPDRLEKLGRTETTIKEYEGLLSKLMGPLEARFETGDKSNV